MHNTESFFEDGTQNLMGFWHPNRSPNPGPTTRPYNNQQKKKTRRIVDFAVPTDHRVKLKESEKKNKYLNLVRELKKLWNMKVMFIPIVIGALSTVIEGLIKVLENEWRPSKLLHNWHRLEYWEVSWSLDETYYHSNFCERPSANGGARGVMVIFVGNGYGDTSSNPRRNWLHFT